MKDGGLVKTRNFKSPVYIGDPINALRIFNEKEVDELVLLDISATIQNRDPNYSHLMEIVSESFMPLGYGGGIKSLDQIKKLFNTGLEKIILNSSSLNFDLISKAASIYGSQSIVVCIDVRKSIIGKYMVYTHAGTEKQKVSPDLLAKSVTNAGAGEIIIQSIDKEGTMNGYDLALVKKVSESVDVPIVALGGAGNLSHFYEAIYKGGASAVAAGSYFVYKGKHRGVLINYPSFETIKELFDNA